MENQITRLRNDMVDIEYPVVVTQEEAQTGVQRTLRFYGPDGRERTLEAHIPAGVITGSRVRLAVDPERYGFSCSSLTLVVTIVPHQTIEYRGDDLHVSLLLDRATALQERMVKVAVGNNQSILVPIHPQMTSDVYVYAGHGLARASNPRLRGNLVLRVELVDIPGGADGDGAAREHGGALPRRPLWW